MNAQPWFNDPDQTQMVMEFHEDAVGPAMEASDRGLFQREPYEADIAEFEPVAFGRIRFFLPVVIFSAFLGTAQTIVQDVWTTPVWMDVLVLAFSLGFSAFTYTFSEPLRAAICGQRMGVAATMHLVAERFPRVFATTLLTTILLMVGFAMCLLPGLIALPFLVRAPYEAAMGHGPLTAVQRAFKAGRDFKPFSFRVANLMLYAITALVAVTAMSEELLRIGLFSVAAEIYVPEAARLVIMPWLWFGTFTSFVAQDAAMSGAIGQENHAENRVQAWSTWQRLTMSRGWSFGRSLIGGACLAFLIFFTTTGGGSLGPAISVGATAPAFALEDLDGSMHVLDDYRDHPTVIYFWAPWCGPCKEQVTEMNTLKREREDINIVAIAMSFESEDELRRYVEDYKVTYQILVADQDVDESYGIQAFPTLFVVDEFATVLLAEEGVVTAKEIGEIAPERGD